MNRILPRDLDRDLFINVRATIRAKLKINRINEFIHARALHNDYDNNDDKQFHDADSSASKFADALLTQSDAHCLETADR